MLKKNKFNQGKLKKQKLSSKNKIMNIINILRKPYLGIFLASLMLFASCSQYDSDVSNQSFDYKGNSFFKSNQNLINVVTLNLDKKNQTLQEILVFKY